MSKSWVSFAREHVNWHIVYVSIPQALAQPGDEGTNPGVADNDGAPAVVEGTGDDGGAIESVKASTTGEYIDPQSPFPSSLSHQSQT
jgi:hypothetical protein